MLRKDRVALAMSLFDGEFPDSEVVKGCFRLRNPYCDIKKAYARTLDFLLRHAIQAVLTHLLLLAAEESLSFLRDFDLVGSEGELAELALLLSVLSWVEKGLVMESSASRACGWSPSMGS